MKNAFVYIFAILNIIVLNIAIAIIYIIYSIRTMAQLSIDILRTAKETKAFDSVWNCTWK